MTLAELAQRYWDLSIGSSPLWANLLADHRFDDQVADHTEEGQARLAADITAVANEAEDIDVAGLSRDDRITRAVLLFEARNAVDRLHGRHDEFAVDPHMGLHVEYLSTVSQMQAAEPEHADAFIAKYDKMGSVFDAAVQRLQAGIRNGRTPPAVSVQRSLRQLDDYLDSPIGSDPFLQVQPPAMFTSDQVVRWRDQLADRVYRVIRPAYERYRDALRGEVAAAARPQEKSGVGWLPDGEELYAAAVRTYTSLPLTADEIHCIGKDDITRLEDEYRQLGSAVLTASKVADMYTELRDDPELRFSTAEEVKAAAEGSLARAEAAAPQWFGRLPQAHCVVEPIPSVTAPEATIAYYLPPAADGSRPGTYFINLYQPETRTRFEAESLAFHESVPGHHLQLAIAQEMERLPEFRKHALVTVYVEGWGLYTERLADEMTLYSSDTARLGMLSFDSWRACRLVVDTGLHTKGWSRQQAIDYMRDNSPQALNNIENEVDRYIGWPGQALAYKIGQREIFRLRENARRRMGSRFDVKAFHDTVLQPGPVPLQVLGELVDEWVLSA